MRTDAIIVAYQAGQTGVQIAQEADLALGDVYAILDASGIQRRTSSEQTTNVLNAIACEKLLRHQFETGAYWNMTPAQARAKLAELGAGE